MRVAIIDYGSGNLRSASKAFERAAGEADIRADIQVTNHPEDVANADRIVLPGVGAFADCKSGLYAISGMHDALEQSVCSDGRPFLGICVGMQLMASRGLEHGVTEGLNWIGGEVRPIEPTDRNLKIPHMGWNTLEVTRTHRVLEGIEVGRQGLHAYFVHSYYHEPENGEDVLATTDYGGSVTAMIAKDNMIGTQFHPEKSQKLGLALIRNFLKWTP